MHKKFLRTFAVVLIVTSTAATFEAKSMEDEVDGKYVKNMKSLAIVGWAPKRWEELNSAYEALMAYDNCPNRDVHGNRMNAGVRYCYTHLGRTRGSYVQSVNESKRSLLEEINRNKK